MQEEEERKRAGSKGAVQTPDTTRPHRIRSRFTANTTPAHSSKFRVVCAPTTTKYQASIRAVVSALDSVLVVCAENNDGDVEAAVSAAGNEWHVAVSHGSAWDVSGLLAMQRDRAGFTVACLDLTTSGHSLEADCHALLRMLRSVFETTLHTVVLKSKALERHARRFHNSHSFLQRGLPSAHVSEDVQIVCAEGVSDYRATIPRILSRDDAVLEVGCADGATTQLLAAHLAVLRDGEGRGEADARVVGVDVGAVGVQSCAMRTSNAVKRRRIVAVVVL